jgi:hypothetical protein
MAAPENESELSSTEVEPGVPAQGLRHAARAFKHRDFTVFWLGALESNTGSWFQNLAVP